MYWERDPKLMQRVSQHRIHMHIYTHNEIALQITSYNFRRWKIDVNKFVSHQMYFPVSIHLCFELYLSHHRPCFLMSLTAIINMVWGNTDDGTELWRLVCVSVCKSPLNCGACSCWRSCTRERVAVSLSSLPFFQLFNSGLQLLCLSR